MTAPDITIPPKALEAAARVLHDQAEIFDDLPLEDLSVADQNAYIEEARAACLAMLKAWPGSYSLAENDSAVIRDFAAIILPLPQEPTND